MTKVCHGGLQKADGEKGVVVAIEDIGSRLGLPSKDVCTRSQLAAIEIFFGREFTTYRDALSLMFSFFLQPFGRQKCCNALLAMLCNLPPWVYP